MYAEIALCTVCIAAIAHREVSLTAEMGKRSYLFQTVWLVLLSCCFGVIAESEYWVVPAKEDCQHKENCSTLEEYVKTGAFNQSNVVWIFKEGKHALNGTIVPFTNVHNVTLMGSRECEPPDIDNCTIQCIGDQVCMFLFVTSNNITISNLRFVHQDTFDLNPVSENTLRQYLPMQNNLCYSYSLGFPSSMAHAHYKNCLHDRSWVFVDTVNVTVSNITFVGRNSYWAVVRPNGKYTVSNCQFHRLFLAQSSISGDPQHYMTVVLRKPLDRQSTLAFLITNSKFTSNTFFPSIPFIRMLKKNHMSNTTEVGVLVTYPAVHVISDMPLSGWKTNFTIHKCSFRKCSPFQLTAVEDPGLTVTLNTVNANARNQKLQEWWAQVRYPFLGSAIRLFLTNCYTPKMHQIQTSAQTSKMNQHLCVMNSSAPLSNITLISSNFTLFTSDKGCTFLYQGHIAEGCPRGLRIVLQSNSFAYCYSQKFRSTVYAHQDHMDQHLVDHHTHQGNEPTHDEHMLVIDSNINKQNFMNNKLDTRCVVFERHPDSKTRYQTGSVSYKIRCEDCQDSCIGQGVYFISGFQQKDRVLFSGNRITVNMAQGLTLVGSVLELAGTNFIQRSKDYYGGGLAMYDNSQLWIRNGSQLDVSRNHAIVRGGGIFIHDSCPAVHSRDCPCFFQFIGNDGMPLRNTSADSFSASVTLHKNTVRVASRARATMIFNSNIDNCALKGLFNDSVKKELFQRVFGIVDLKNITQDKISSITRSFCNCSNDNDRTAKCTPWRYDLLPVYPGQNLTLNVMVLGDMRIPLENVLYVRLEEKQYAKQKKSYFPLPLHSTHVLQSDCNKITIPPLPPEGKSPWVLQLMVPLIPGRNQDVFLYAYIQTRTSKCPKAYSLVKSDSQIQCECYKFLYHMKVKCLLDVQQFTLPKNYWISTEEGNKDNSNTKVLLSADCPKIYCITTKGGKQVSLDEPDKQCTHGRSGVLCGQCPKGKSVVGYSFACKTCTNWGVLLLVPFLIAGPLLIALICCLNLTISVGSINGFLLYINIIGIHRDTLTISTGDSTQGMRLIGAIPVDGICIYDGMDEFASTLLSYLFPMYLLTLVGVICLLPKCKCVNMHKINRRIGPRITPVLATIILLSYTQLAESVIRSLLYVELFETDGTNTTSRLVWMFDGSLEYFHSPKHIILACLALLVLTCFLLPVTVIAIFGDLFRRFFRGPWYMNFLDTFHGAFRFRFGFWIGIRILLRILSMVMKIFLPVNELFLITAYTIMTLLFLQILIRPFRGIRVDECVSKRIKEKHFPEPLQRELVHSIDHSFLVNLIAVFMYLPYDVQNTATVLIVSRVIAYMEFTSILLYHTLEYSPVGPFIFDNWFKLRRRYRRWREKRREAVLARKWHIAEGTERHERHFDLVLRASDCTDSDYEDSESNEDSVTETPSDHVQEVNEALTNERDCSSSVDVPLSSGLTTPLLRKLPRHK